MVTLIACGSHAVPLQNWKPSPLIPVPDFHGPLSVTVQTNDSIPTWPDIVPVVDAGGSTLPLSAGAAIAGPAVVSDAIVVTRAMSRAAAPSRGPRVRSRCE